MSGAQIQCMGPTKWGCGKTLGGGGGFFICEI